MPESDDTPPPADGSLPTNFGGLNPGELLARGLQAAKMSSAGTHGWEPPSVEEVARLFPTYEVVAMLGRGGMGAVFKARQLALDRLVAIKLLPLEISVNQDFVDRFRREARAMAKLNHPNIVSVHEFGQTSEGHLFIVMEFVEGANLAAIIHQVGLDPEQALSLAGQICTALAYAHSKGIVHRDIKPANVIVNTESHVKVADFGLARLSDPGTDDLGHTVLGTVMGTPDYMAPEQKRGMDVDHRADIYSLGVMLYEMLCRKVPHGIFAPPSQCIGCDERLDYIVIRAMQQQPELRYQSTTEMKSDVETARTPPPVPIPEVMRASPPKPKSIGLRVGVGVGFVALVVAAVFAMKSNPMSPQKGATPIKETTRVQQGETKMPQPTPTPIASLGTTALPAASKIDQPKLEPMEVQPVVTPKTEPGLTSTPMPMTPAPRAATPTPLPVSATGKWLAEQEPKWRAAFEGEVIAPFEKGAGDLKKQYVAALNDTLSAAARDARLTVAVAVRAELQLLAAGGTVSAEDAPSAPDALKTLRSTYRKAFAVLDAERFTRAKTVHARCDTILMQNQTLLTQRQRLDEALEIQAKREQLTAAWLKPPAAAAPAPIPALSSATVTATKDAPFVNTLGMKFVPVPIIGGQTGGQRVLFGVWDTRVQDYEVFAKETKREWPKPDFAQEPTHPAVNVSWEDATVFCMWLTERERKAGRLPAEWRYRLPGDHEWSSAVGLGARESAAKLPAEKSEKINDAFPWGTRWPPPKGAGNYTGEELRPAQAAGKHGWIKDVLAGYNDGFVETAPVGSFAANRFGLFDMGGNVWQWCEDWFDKEQKDRVQRGAAWDAGNRGWLSSSTRNHGGPGYWHDTIGFRCVLAPASAAK